MCVAQHTTSPPIPTRITAYTSNGSFTFTFVLGRRSHPPNSSLLPPFEPTVSTHPLNFTCCTRLHARLTSFITDVRVCGITGYYYTRYGYEHLLQCTCRSMKLHDHSRRHKRRSPRPLPPHTCTLSIFVRFNLSFIRNVSHFIPDTKRPSCIYISSTRIYFASPCPPIPIALENPVSKRSLLYHNQRILCCPLTSLVCLQK